MYKVKAFKRRTLHAVQKTVAKVEVTKDEEYNLLHGKYVDVEHRMSRINTSIIAYRNALANLAQVGVALADDLVEIYETDSTMRPLAVMFKDAHDTLNEKVLPIVDMNFEQEVVAPTMKVMDRMKGIKDDDERRRRYISDYDHYRHKYRTLQESPKKEKIGEHIRECEAKLNIASEKYHTMNERLSARLRTADKHKDTLFNEQLFALVRCEQAFFSQGSNEFDKLLQSSVEKRYKQAAAGAAEDLARADAAVKSMHGGTGRTGSMAMSGAGGGMAMSNASWGSSPAGSPRNTFDKKGGSSSNFEDAFGSPAVGKPQAAFSGGGAKRARALFEYEATADTELDLKEGQIITIVREDDSGWWQGEYNGKVGWFPYNYVEIL